MHYFLDLLSQLEQNLHFIELENTDLLKRSAQSAEVCDVALQQLRTIVLRKGFGTREDEIEFFKFHKPRVMVPFNFAIMQYELEKKKPASLKAEIIYYEQKVMALEHEMFSDTNFYLYYKTKSTELDEFYFVRKQGNKYSALHEGVFAYDKVFNTGYDSKWSKIQAFERLIVFYNEEIKRLKHAEDYMVVNRDSLLWTDNKSSFVELIYALHETKAINNGKMEVRHLAESLAAAFGIDVPDLYRTYNEISRRKEPAKFIDHLITNLNKKIQDDHA